MSITLAVGATSIDLHPDLYWSDENNWHPVEQTVQRTLTGALIVSSATRLAGRPITLEPEDDSCAWMNGATKDQLRNWAAVAGQQMTLTLRGQARTVIFRHQDGPGVEARPVVHYSDVVDGDWFLVTLRLMEI
ncbi:hypothetical protein [Cupriavidus sp. CuC1]|uniref:hypothetical protein n=1 Tax=Cupriavidus sp. CuC1 TaxID=3373131 RepID=UPI0037CFFE1E